MQFDEIQTLGVAGVKTPVNNIAPTIRAMTYRDWLEPVDSFLSLDISVHGTGWVLYDKKQLTWGRISLKETEEVKRMHEFGAALLVIIQNRVLDYIFVEDAIQSMNFKTVRSLVTLNSVIDTLIYEQKVSIGKKLYRVQNTTWKKNLKAIAGDIVVKGVDYLNGADKEATKACLESLGVSVEILKNKKYTDKQVEDICDAFGMALGTIAAEIIRTPVIETKPKVQKVDIRKGYKIKQFDTIEEAEKSAKRSSKGGKRTIVTVDLTEITDTNLVKYMAKQLEEDATAIYVVRTPVSKCCNVLLIKQLQVTAPITNLVIYK